MGLKGENRDLLVYKCYIGGVTTPKAFRGSEKTPFPKKSLIEKRNLNYHFRPLDKTPASDPQIYTLSPPNSFTPSSGSERPHV